MRIPKPKRVKRVSIGRKNRITVPKIKEVSIVNTVEINHEEDNKKLTCLSKMRKRIRKSLNGKYLSDQEIKSVMESIRYGK